MTQGFSTDEQHRATLAMLQEALDYLLRMPRSPVTTQMCRKIEAHLEAPSASLVARTQDVWEAEAVSPVGVMWFTARLQGDDLTVCIPPRPKAILQSEYDRLVLRGLAGGLRMRLKNTGPAGEL